MQRFQITEITTDSPTLAVHFVQAMADRSLSPSPPRRQRDSSAKGAPATDGAASLEAPPEPTPVPDSNVGEATAPTPEIAPTPSSAPVTSGGLAAVEKPDLFAPLVIDYNPAAVPQAAPSPGEHQTLLDLSCEVARQGQG